MVMSKDMTTNNIDIDVFISEIENRPAIWDMRCELYSNTEQKTKAWEEVCLKCIPDFETKTTKEKNTAATQLQRKWKSLHGSYTREQNKRKNIKSGFGASGRKAYTHFQQLSFLSVLAETRPESQDVEQEQDPTSPVPSVAHIGTTKKRRAMSIVEKTELDLLSNISKKINSEDHSDSDRNFLLSLLPDVKTIREEFKLNLKVEMLSVIQKYKNLHIQQPHYQNQLHYQNQPLYGQYTEAVPLPQVPSRVNIISNSVSRVSKPLHDYGTQRDVFAPGHSQDYNNEMGQSALGFSHDSNSSSYVPVSTPTPALSTSTHSISDTSIIDDIFYDN